MVFLRSGNMAQFIVKTYAQSSSETILRAFAYPFPRWMFFGRLKMDVFRPKSEKKTFYTLKSPPGAGSGPSPRLKSPLRPGDGPESSFHQGLKAEMVVFGLFHLEK